MLSDHVMERLVFIKNLLNTAVDQSRQPWPVAATSILSFHDSVELFLVLASEHANVGAGKKTDFMEYFGLLQVKLGQDLEQRDAMKRLNDIRVALKHNGVLPHISSIEVLRANTRSFFEQNSEIIFGISFEAISMINLVQYDDVRSRLTTARQLIDAGDRRTARDEIAIAFYILNQHLFSRVDSLQWIGSRYGASSDVQVPSPDMDQNVQASFYQIVRKFSEIEGTLGGLRRAIMLSDAGISHQRYAKFYKLTPTVTTTQRHSSFIYIKHFSNHPEDEAHDITEEECNFCYNFVIDCALRAQAFNSSI